MKDKMMHNKIQQIYEWSALDVYNKYRYSSINIKTDTESYYMIDFIKNQIRNCFNER